MGGNMQAWEGKKEKKKEVTLTSTRRGSGDYNFIIVFVDLSVDWSQMVDNDTELKHCPQPKDIQSTVIEDLNQLSKY